MHYIRLTNGDAHFQENVKLAGEWAEEGSIQLTIKAIPDGKVFASGQRKIFPIRRMSMTIRGDNEPIVKYSQFQEEKQLVRLSSVIEVAWRPDIRRYMNRD